MRARPGSERDLDAYASALGLRFKNRDRFAEALTHSSAAGAARPDNQRLEFLGDRVLGLVIAEALMTRFPAEAEGTLAPRLNDLVRRETLAEVAVEIDLGAHLVLGRSEGLSGGRRKKAILADALEALIAAIYLDAGLEGARAFVLAHWAARLAGATPVPTDAKSALQAWVQARGQSLPVYEIVAQSGPAHAPRFVVAVTIESGERAEGEAASKRPAEQAAAAALLRRLESDAAIAGDRDGA
ncbi:MAG: ribonuclease III [Pseudomonadota bacterium]